MNQLAMSLQNCCCENRAGLADLKYTVATENCQDRQALSDGLRDVMAQNTANTNAIVQSQNQGFQNVLDKLCQLEIDNLKAQNQELRSRIQMADLAASQTAQTAQLVQNAQAQTQAVISSCCPKPQPAYVVPNPNCGCGGLYGGCGA
jgi:flagellar motor switch protein FliG